MTTSWFWARHFETIEDGEASWLSNLYAHSSLLSRYTRQSIMYTKCFTSSITNVSDAFQGAVTVQCCLGRYLGGEHVSASSLTFEAMILSNKPVFLFVVVTRKHLINWIKPDKWHLSGKKGFLAFLRDVTGFCFDPMPLLLSCKKSV